MTTSNIDKQKDKYYLTKVDKLENHIDKFTLMFLNEDFENEWRLHEITQRHNLIYVCICYIIFVDVIFGMILSNTTR